MYSKKNFPSKELKKNIILINRPKKMNIIPQLKKAK